MSYVSILGRLILTCVPALALVTSCAIGIKYLLELLALKPLEVFAGIGVLIVAKLIGDLVWTTYFRWISKFVFPEFHKLWFPEER